MPVSSQSTVMPSRRHFLRAAGVCLALPTMEALQAGDGSALVAERPDEVKRMVCIGNEFGMYPGAFWPEQAGADYALSPLLAPLRGHVQDMTLFSHLDHGLKGGHFAVHTFLTGVKSVEARGMPDGGISLDQRAAEFVGSKTRFPSLTIGSESGLHGGPCMSWTRTGTRVPPISGPRELFRALFVDQGQAGKHAATERLDLQASILDHVMEDARTFQKRVSRADRQKLDEYFSSVRDVEQKLSLDRKWQTVPKPQAPVDEPMNRNMVQDLPLLYDLILLALQTDSTRVATLEIGGSFIASDLGIKAGYHGLSHHGKKQSSIDLLVEIERYQVEQFARFLGKLKETQEPGTEGSLLDSTMVLFGSGMGNANSHTNADLPVVLAGGGFRHGEHKRYPSESNRRIPLCNLYLSMLQSFGLELDAFGQSTGTLREFEWA